MKYNLKKISIFLILSTLTLNISAKNLNKKKDVNSLTPSNPVSNSNSNNKSAGLQDVSYNFDQSKVQASQDTFHFLRSFVDYFYLIIKNNPNSLPTINSVAQYDGWVVGDAHAENFGVLVKQNNSYVFTHNDMDDSGPTAVIYDLYRLMVSSKLYDSNIDLDQMLKAYLSGLKNETFNTPTAIQSMIQKSQKDGMNPSKNKIQNNKIVRDSQSNEVDEQTLIQLQNIVKNLHNVLSSNAQLIDAVQTSKIGGGSGGLNRYEILINNNGSLLHLELKKEITPSIYPVATSDIPNTNERIAMTIKMDQGSNASPFYQVVNINGDDMLLRPRFAGNVGVSLDKQSLGDNEDIIYYESYSLGQIHSRSVKNLANYTNAISNLNLAGISSDVSLMINLFNQKYSSLK